MGAYNLFRRKTECGVYCAVPEDWAIPSFVQGRAWAYSGGIEGDARTLVGFDARAAATSVRFNGFYLFEGFGLG